MAQTARGSVQLTVNLTHVTTSCTSCTAGWTGHNCTIGNSNIDCSLVYKYGQRFKLNLTNQRWDLKTKKKIHTCLHVVKLFLKHIHSISNLNIYFFLNVYLTGIMWTVYLYKKIDWNLEKINLYTYQVFNVTFFNELLINSKLSTLMLFSKLNCARNQSPYSFVCLKI